MKAQDSHDFLVEIDLLEDSLRTIFRGGHITKRDFDKRHRALRQLRGAIDEAPAPAKCLEGTDAFLALAGFRMFDRRELEAYFNTVRARIKFLRRIRWDIFLVDRWARFCFKYKVSNVFVRGAVKLLYRKERLLVEMGQELRREEKSCFFLLSKLKMEVRAGDQRVEKIFADMEKISGEIQELQEEGRKDIADLNRLRRKVMEDRIDVYKKNLKGGGYSNPGLGAVNDARYYCQYSGLSELTKKKVEIRRMQAFMDECLKS